MIQTRMMVFAILVSGGGGGESRVDASGSGDWGGCGGDLGHRVGGSGNGDSSGTL